MNRIGAFVLVALISAAITFYVMRSSGADSGRCDVHPHISSAGLATLKANLERARRIAHDAALADKHDADQANRAGEDAAADNFVFNLRDALIAEYQRHRQALDGCF